LKARDWL